MFTDSHCHITKETCENINKLINVAKENNIYRMINNGTDGKTNEEVIDISKKYKEILPAIGIHPEFTDFYTEKDLKYIEKNINNVVAIGEIGLDYHYDNCNKEKQKMLFKMQLNLAEKNKKPVIIHSRDATEDTIKILDEYPNLRGIIHCFSGSLETAKIYIKKGYKLGIGGVLTFKNSNLHKVIEQLPIECIVIETDSPYLSPEPKRGEKNEPANAIYVAKRICEIKGISIQKLSEITEKNLSEIFDI